MVDKVVDFEGSYYKEMVLAIVLGEGGIPVVQHGVKIGAYYSEDAEQVEWVTPVTTYNRQEGAFASEGYDEDALLNMAYGDVCMVVRIGKAGNRLAYPKPAQVKRKY